MRAFGAAILLFASAALAQGASLHATASPGVWSGEAQAGAPGSASFAQSFERLMEDGQAPKGFQLALEFPDPVAVRVEDLAALPRLPPVRPPRTFWIGASSAVAVMGSAWNALHEEPRFGFHVTNEGWFGRHTYAGGADKASHFVSYYSVARILTAVYGGLGVSQDNARLLGSGVSFLAGLVTELGDGTNKYGFSHEDVISDALGAASALATAHYGLEDLVGFRVGVVPAPGVYEFLSGGLGKDYSKEIYTADLKLGGLARRLRLRPGLTRFLLLSMTYGVKGYPYAPAEVRERQVGFEIGLDMSEILRAAGVPERKWWGKALILFFDTVRIPYTAWGFRYDLNHSRWHGPDTGNTFPAGDH
jgi:hypothetical protein